MLYPFTSPTRKLSPCPNRSKSPCWGWKRNALPPLLEGRYFRGGGGARETVMDLSVVQRTDLKVGDEIKIRSTQGTKDEFYTLKIVGLVGEQAYSFQVVETFAHLIHENDRAGIMVTHDLRMCQFVNRVLQMQDGKLVQIYQSRQDIMELAQGTLKH